MKKKKVTSYPVSIKQLKGLIERLESKDESTQTVFVPNGTVKGNMIVCKRDPAFDWLIYMNNEKFDPILK